MSTLYDVGDAVRVTASFHDEAGDLANPTTVTAEVLAPDGTTVVPSVASTIAGIWSFIQELDQEGMWSFRIAGEGTIAAAAEGGAYVQLSSF